MASETRPPIPVNIISGPLGVGKTTAINHLLSLRPPDETWAILVNEYGLVGLDAALIDTPSKTEAGVNVKEVAGGCICCSAGIVFEVSLVQLLQRRPDRLLIEPTGLASVSGILDTLNRKGIRESVTVRTVITLLDAKTYLDDVERIEVIDQVEAADVVLANRADLVSSEEIFAFESWAGSLFPRKARFGRLTRGRIPLELLDLITEKDTSAVSPTHEHGVYNASDDDDHSGHHEHDHSGYDHSGHESKDHSTHDGHAHDHDHHHDHSEHQHSDSTVSSEPPLPSAGNPIVARHHESALASSFGWICWKDIEFDARRTHVWLSGLASLPAVRRVKAVLHTNEGWWAFNFAGEEAEVRPVGYRRDSRVELVVQGEGIDAQMQDAALRACVVRAAVE